MRGRLLAALALTAALLASPACTPEEQPPSEAHAPTPRSEPPPAPAEPAPPAEEPEPEPEPEYTGETPRAVFLTDDGPVVVITEVADTEEARARGLMFRESLPEGAGMLFVFPDRARQSFWMKNTFIPLDMIFLDDGSGGGPLRVVGVVHEAEPRTLTPRGVRAPSRWVVEVMGGFAQRHGIREGVRVRLEGLR